MRFAEEITRLYALVDLLAVAVEEQRIATAAVLAENVALRAENAALRSAEPAAKIAEPVVVPPRESALVAKPPIAPRTPPRLRAPLSPTQAAVRDRIRLMDVDTFSRGMYRLQTSGGAH